MLTEKLVPPMENYITVIIPNWNGEELLRQCLLSLAVQNFKAIEIAVVDNASSDDSVAMIEKEFSHVKIFKMPENLGFSRAVNVGIRYAKTPFVLLLNNDTVVDALCLGKLYHHILHEKPHCAGVQCRMMNYYEPNIIDSLGIKILKGNFRDIAKDQEYTDGFRYSGQVLGLCAGAALFRRIFFDDVGFFDERFFAGFEDVDIALRGRHRGWYFTYEPAAVVYHHRSRTFNKMSFHKTLELRKNYYLLGFKNLPRQRFGWLTFRLFNVLQKDFFNSIAHIRKGRLLHVWKMYGTVFSNLGAVLKERQNGGLSDEEFESLLKKSEAHGVWRS